MVNIKGFLERSSQETIVWVKRTFDIVRTLPLEPFFMLWCTPYRTPKNGSKFSASRALVDLMCRFEDRHSSRMRAHCFRRKKPCGLVVISFVYGEVALGWS